MLTVILISFAFLFLTFYFLRWRPAHRSIAEFFHSLASVLSLKDYKIQKYPMPTLVGYYFGFRLTLEGSVKKSRRFLATVELPKAVSLRLFLLQEELKTSFKPIAELSLVTTGVKKFNEDFLLMADDLGKAKTIFQPYLCEKILSLGPLIWKLDVHGKEAHLEMHPSILQLSDLANLINVVAELLNDLLLIEGQ